MDLFKIKTIDRNGGEDWVFFGNRPLISQHPPTINILKELNISHKDYVEKANLMFNEYNVVVPKNYPADCIRDSALYGKTFVDPWTEFTICVGCCILIRENNNLDVSRIIRKELIENNSRSGILHAKSLSTIALYYLNKGLKVDILKEIKDTFNPDMKINEFECEVKVVDSSDWTDQVDLTTGESKKIDLNRNICYDLGQFIGKENCGYKGIKQSDIIFADLSRKSFGKINNEYISNNQLGLAKLQKHRIIYFYNRILDFYSFYLDFDPYLWKLIKHTEQEHRFAIVPPPNVGPMNIPVKKIKFKGQSANKA